MAYTTLTDLTENTTLTAGTYYLENNVNLNGYTLTLVGPIIIKRNGDVYFTNVGVVNTISSPLNKVYWTVKDDDTVGEIIEGSTGSPSASGGSFNNSVNITSTHIFRYWELRWIDNKQFLKVGAAVNFYHQNIDFKNCSFSSVIVFEVSTVSNHYFENINFDSTNTLSGTAILMQNVYKSSQIKNIFVENSSTTTQVLYISIITVFGYINNIFEFIRIKNTASYGIKIVSRAADSTNPNTQFTLKNVCASINFVEEGTGTGFYLYFRNCLFDYALTGWQTYAIGRNASSNGVHKFNIQNCIFRGYTTCFKNAEYGGNRATYFYLNNNVFYSNTKLLAVGGRITADYNGYYNNNETGWTRGANDFTADPQFQNAPSGCVIDTEFNKYLPDGYFVGNYSAYEAKGSDTYFNLGINEDSYTATGYWYPNGNDIIVPGINYLVTSFSSTPVPQVQLGINLTEGQIGQIIPLTDNSYLVSSFSMLGTQENLASLRSLTSGQQVTLDLTSVGDQTLNHCSFKDIKCINGTISVLNGEDLGNNEGITFTTAAEDLAISVTAGNIQEILLDEFVYNVTSFSMQGQNGNLAYLRSKILNSPVTLDLTTVGSQTLTHCSFRDIHVTNGTITVTDGLDLGGNEGITFISSEIPSDIEINVNENETQILFPKLEPYNVTSFNMTGSNGRPATLKSSVEGTPVILDMSSFPISNLEYCDFQDIELLNGTIVSTNGKDLGGNTGITFQQTEIPEDCVDWKITEELINQLSTMSTGYNTQVKTVQLIESEFKSPDSFPVLIVCPNEIDPDQEYASRNDTLPFALIYIDDSTETNLHYRFRNVPADVQKCLKKNETLSYLAHYVKVDNWENSVFEVGGIEFACCIIYVSVERRLDACDPYKLA